MIDSFRLFMTTKEGFLVDERTKAVILVSVSDAKA